MDDEIQIMAFDVSKRLVRQALERYEAKPYLAKASFFSADASRFPVRDACFDRVVLYGVLHHLPAPPTVCREIARVLKPGGLYFGHENNRSVFRPVFDFLQRVFPIWIEEAGEEPLVSHAVLSQWFSGTGMAIDSKTSVFVPPHLVNLMPSRLARLLMAVIDRTCQHVPIIGRNGGIILVRGEKRRDGEFSHP
jgi:SAM-dependent methyltransferase